MGRVYSNMAKDVFKSKIEEDISNFFSDNNIKIKEIKQHSSDSIKFWQVHFDNDTRAVEIALLSTKLLDFGYSCSMIFPNLPDSFYVIATVVKKL